MGSATNQRSIASWAKPTNEEAGKYSMTNTVIIGILLDLVGANIHAHKVISDLVSKLPQEEQAPYLESLHGAFKANGEAFEQLKKVMHGNG